MRHFQVTSLGLGDKSERSNGVSVRGTSRSGEAGSQVPVRPCLFLRRALSAACAALDHVAKQAMFCCDTELERWSVFSFFCAKLLIVSLNSRFVPCASSGIDAPARLSLMTCMLGKTELKILMLGKTKTRIFMLGKTELKILMLDKTELKIFAAWQDRDEDLNAWSRTS